MLTEKDLQNIEKYLAKELIGNEKQAFEEEMKARPELYAEAKFQRSTQLALKRLAIQEKEAELRAYLQPFREKLTVEPATEEVEQEKASPFTKIWRNNNFKLAIAASFIGALVAASYVYFTTFETNPSDGLSSNQSPADTVRVEKRTDTTEEKDDVQLPPITPKTPQVASVDERYLTLYDNYYSDLPASRGAVDLPDELNEVISLYRAGSYGEALEAFPDESELNELITSYPSDESKTVVKDNYQLYKGLSQLGLKDYEGAIKSFNKITSLNGNSARSAAWYTGLAHLRLGKIVDAQSYFEGLSKDTRNTYARDSYLILQKLAEIE